MSLEKKGFSGATASLTSPEFTDRGIRHSSIGTLSQCKSPIQIHLPSAYVSVMQLNPRPKKSFNEYVSEFDFLGLILSIGGVVCILLGFNYSETSWSDPKTIALLVVGVVLLALCAVNEAVLTTRRPIFPPRMFKTVTTAGLLLSSFIQFATFTGTSFYLPNYYQVHEIRTCRVSLIDHKQ